MILCSLRLVYILQYIPAKFSCLTDNWNDFDCIEVAHDYHKWNIMIKKNGRRCQLYTGWVAFRIDLDLGYDDICVFKMMENIRKFEVEIYKNVA